MELVKLANNISDQMLKILLKIAFKMIVNQVKMRFIEATVLAQYVMITHMQANLTTLQMDKVFV